jgi:hypothetical protein
MLAIKGKQYLSLKDACALSGSSYDEMRSLCAQGLIASVWYDHALLVEQQSLETLIRQGDVSRIAKDMSGSEEVWRRNVSKRFLTVAGAIVAVTLVLSLPLLISGTVSPQADIEAVASTYNTMRVFSEADSGVAAALASINETVGDAIARVIFAGFELFF